MSNRDVIITKEAEREVSASYLLKKNGFEIHYADDKLDVLTEYIDYYDPIAVVVPAYIEGVSALQFTERIREETDIKRTMIIVEGCDMTPAAKVLVSALGADCFVDSSHSKKDAREEIVKMIDAGRLLLYRWSVRTFPMAEEIVEKELIKSKISENMQGFYYLREAILTQLEAAPGIMQSEDFIYREIARKFYTTPILAKRAMKIALCASSQRGILTIPEFIDSVVDRLLDESEEGA